MQGIIFVLFSKFVRENFDYKHLNQIKTNADLAGKFHSVDQAHPDEELFQLVNAASKHLDIDIGTLLESFGNYIGPVLLTTYSSYIDPEWNSLDLLENIESTMHDVVRMNSPDATPPSLEISRINDKKVAIDYTSERRIIQLGIGIIDSISDHYNEDLVIEQEDIPDGTRLVVTLV